jgi:hypothetical protein
MMLTSKYALLVLVNLPLIIIGIVSAVTGYKTSRISKKRCVVEVVFWLLVGVVLSLVEPLYNALVKHNLTDSQPMSIFDMVLLTLILFCFLLIKNANERASQLAKKVSRLHENLVIAEEQRHWDK